MNPKRWPRPWLMYAGVACAFLAMYFFTRIFNAIATAYESAAATRSPVPDMSGGIAAILGGLAALIPPLALIIQQFNNYHRERMDQQARGIPPSGIPPYAPPDNGGSSVNPHGGPDAP